MSPQYAKPHLVLIKAQGLHELVVEQIQQMIIEGAESMAGELACERITNPEFEEIRAPHADMLACHARRDLSAYYRTNQAIHDCINRAARNEVLRQMYTTVNSRVKALRFSSASAWPRYSKATCCPSATRP